MSMKSATWVFELSPMTTKDGRKYVYGSIRNGDTDTWLNELILPSKDFKFFGFVTPENTTIAFPLEPLINAAPRLRTQAETNIPNENGWHCGAGKECLLLESDNSKWVVFIYAKVRGTQLKFFAFVKPSTKLGKLNESDTEGWGIPTPPPEDITF